MDRNATINNNTVDHSRVPATYQDPAAPRAGGASANASGRHAANREQGKAFAKNQGIQLDDKTLERSRAISRKVAKGAEATKESAKTVLGGVWGKSKELYHEFMSDAPVGDKMKKARFYILGIFGMIFGLMGLSGIFDFTKGFFSKDTKRAPGFWKLAQAGLGGMLAAGIYRTLSGKGMAFKNMGSVGVGTVGLLLTSGMNKMYEGKGGILDKIFGFMGTKKKAKGMMDMFRSPINFLLGESYSGPGEGGMMGSTRPVIDDIQDEFGSSM